MLVEEVLLVVGQAPLGHDAAATGDDAGEALGGHGHVAQQHAGVDGEVIHPLLGLLQQGVAEQLPGEILGDAVGLLQRLIDGHCADGHRAVAQYPLPGLVDVAAGGEIHDGVGAPAGGPHQLLHFLLDAGGHRRVADVGVDLHQEVAADDHRLGFRVVDVAGDDGAAGGHLIAHEFGGDVFRQAGAEALTRMLAQQQLGAHPLAAHVLANGDELHLRGDHPLAGIVQLGHPAARPGTQWLGQIIETQVIQPLVGEALLGEGGAQTLERFGVATLQHPGFPQARQAAAHVYLGTLVPIGPRGVVDGHGIVGLELGVFLAAADQGVGQDDLPQPHPDVGTGTLDEDASGVGMGHALEVVDKGLGTGALLPAAGGHGLAVFRRGRHSKTHINWLKLWVFACLEFEEK
ncbi:hypothetical protein D3C85_924320 [compost metagenome]